MNQNQINKNGMSRVDSSLKIHRFAISVSLPKNRHTNQSKSRKFSIKRNSNKSWNVKSVTINLLQRESLESIKPIEHDKWRMITFY